MKSAPSCQRDRRHLPQAGREARALCLRLVRRVLVELPDAGVALEQRAGIDALHAGPAIRILAGVGGRADVDVEAAAAVEGDALVLVLAVGGKAADDRLGRARGLQLAGGELEALDDQRVRKIHVAVADRDASGAARCKALDDLELAVAVGVTQRHRAAAGLRLPAPAAGHQRDVEVAVGRHGHVAGGAEIVGDHQRAEAGRQLDAAVVRVAGRPALAVYGVHHRRRHHRHGGRDTQRPRAHASAHPSDRHASSPACPLDRCTLHAPDRITRMQGGPSGPPHRRGVKRAPCVTAIAVADDAPPLLADEMRAIRLHHRRPRARWTDELGGRPQLPGPQLHARRDAGGRRRPVLRVERRPVGRDRPRRDRARRLSRPLRVDQRARSITTRRRTRRRRPGTWWTSGSSSASRASCRSAR